MTDEEKAICVEALRMFAKQSVSAYSKPGEAAALRRDCQIATDLANRLRTEVS